MTHQRQTHAGFVAAKSAEFAHNLSRLTPGQSHSTLPTMFERAANLRSYRRSLS
jgi:hypothetical protein